MELHLSSLANATDLPVEIVEHKGLGHPDTLCDALAESFSVALSRYYLEHFGAVLHHNVDKALLWGGAARPAFGGGEVIAPIEIFLAGRATCEVAGHTVPVEQLAVDAGRAWLSVHLHALSPTEHIRFHTLVRPGSADLVDLFLRQHKTGCWLANDTSFGAGYAPLSELERVVQAVAQQLREEARTHPAIGEDVKVMGVRQASDIHLTVACALIGRHLPDLSAYLTAREALRARLAQTAAHLCGRPVTVQINAADDDARGEVYLTVTGTSAEAGDDGQTGRGNRVNGLITPYRPMTLEAVAGKNPVSHVGKLYSIAAHRMAQTSIARIPEIAAAEVRLVSQIGRRVDDPHVVDVALQPRAGIRLESLRDPVERLLREEIAQLPQLWHALIAQTVALY